MLASQAGEYRGKYFCLFLIWEEEKAVSAVSLYGHEERTVGIGPEIKPEYRRLGYAAQAMQLAMTYAAKLAFTRAASQIRKDNTASIALHKKLGFCFAQEFVNQRGHSVVWAEREILPQVE